MRTLLAILFLLSSLPLLGQENWHDRPFWIRIDSLYSWQDYECFKDIPNWVSDLNLEKEGHVELWYRCDLGHGGEGIRITYLKKDSPEHYTFYTEEYFLMNGELFYSYIGEKYCQTNKYFDGGWEGWYHFEKGELVNYSTNGHGLSETDDWFADKWVMEKYGRRMTELKRLGK